MIEVGNIVTLENNQEYLILESLSKEEKKYVYSVGVLPDETPTDEYLIFEAIVNGEEEFLKPVNNKDLYDELIEEFKDIVADKIISADIEEFYNNSEESDGNMEEAA